MYVSKQNKQKKNESRYGTGYIFASLISTSRIAREGNNNAKAGEVGGLNSHCASVVVVVFGVMARARGARKRNHTKKDGGRREFIIRHMNVGI
jgi:hypothetical protein